MTVMTLAQQQEFAAFCYKLDNEDIEDALGYAPDWLEDVDPDLYWAGEELKSSLEYFNDGVQAWREALGIEES